MSDRYIPTTEVEVDHVDLMASVKDWHSDRCILQCHDMDSARFIADLMNSADRHQKLLAKLNTALKEDLSASEVLGNIKMIVNWEMRNVG